ncbi:MAG: Ig-like domain-containing protein [Solirubrobacterales bacterium]
MAAWTRRLALRSLTASLIAVAGVSAAPAIASATTGSVALPSSMTIGTGSWTPVSSAGTTPAAADLTGTLRAIVVGTNATVKVGTTTGLTQPTGYTNWTTGATEIAFTGSLADINTALATLSVKGTATGSGSVGVYVVPNGCGPFNPTTGNYYRFTSAVVGDYSSARAYARGLACNGLGGYLASINSSAEMSFQMDKVSNGDGMLGGRKAGGGWTWFDGPAGLSGTPVTYFAGSWCSGEPNNYGGNEVIIWHTYRGCWNDSPENTSGTNYSQPMYIEYGGITGQTPDQEATGTISMSVDGTKPTASWSTTPSSPASANPLAYTLTFSKEVSGLTAGDLTNAGTATGCVLTPASASGTVINVSVSGCSSTGTVIARLAADSVTDPLGNTGPASRLSATSVTIDRTAPTVTWGSAPSSPTSASSLTFPITFSETASGIVAGDFTNAGSATGCSFAPSAASGTTVNVVVTGCSEGTVIPRIAAGSVTDAAGNSGPATAQAAGTGTVDRPAPVPTWGSAPPTPTSATTLTWGISFSESVSGIAAADFNNAGTATGCVFTPSAASGTSINVVVTGCSATGTVTPRLLAGGVADAAGNTAPASALNAGTVTVDRTAPTVSWTSPPASPSNSASITYSITFSEEVSGIAAGDFTNIGSAVGCVFTPSAATGTSITLVASGCGAGTVQPRLAANSITDTAGNTGPALISDGSLVTIDRTAPTVTWGATPSSPTNLASLTFPINFSETVVGVVAGDFTNAGTATGCSFAPSTSTGTTINIVVSGCGTGTVIPRLAADGVSDAAGNTAPPTALNAGTVTVDRTPATVSWTSSPASPTSSAILVWSLSFSETVSGIAAADFSNAGTATGCIFTPSAAMAASINLTVSNCSNGTVIPVLAANGVLDPVNNPSPSSASTAPAVSRDSTAPTVSATTPASNGSPGDLVYTFTFSEEIAGLASGDFSNTSNATGCSFTPSSSTGTVITVTASGCSAGGVAIRLAAGSVTDLAGNTGPATAYTGTVVRNGARSQPNFKINSLGASPYTLRTGISSFTGDDRGGIAITTQKVFVGGDASLGSFNLSDLGSPAAAVAGPAPSWWDGLVSDLRARKAYSFDGPNYASGNGAGGTITGLTELDPTTGQRTLNKVTLSQPLTVSGTNGIFSGYGRVVIWDSGNNRVYDIEMPSGTVDDLGVRSVPAGKVASEAPSGSSWGTAEYFDGQLYLNYVETSTRIVRMRVSDGVTTTLGSFPSGLGDMASFTVDPSTNRWYFRFETASSTFSGGGDENVGFSVASFTTGPGATWGTAPSSPNNASSLTFPITFSDTVSGVASGDFSNLGTATGCSITPSAASGTLISVSVSGCSEGTVQLRLAANSVTDANGNPGPSTATDSGTVTIDRTAPTAAWSGTPATPTSSATQAWTLTFSESVSGVTSGDFTNAGTATGCTFTPSGSSGTTFTVTASGCGDGTVAPRLAASAASDAAGNAAPASPADGGTVTVDRSGPVGTWGSAPSSPTNAGSLTFPISFNETASGIASGDFTNAGSATGCTFTPSAPSGTSISVVASGCSEGTVQPRLASGAVTDALGNTGPASAATATSVTVDRSAPTATWGSSPASPTNASSLTFPLSFGESASGIDSGDFTNAGTATGCAFTPSATGGTSIDVVASGCSEGTVQPRLASGGVTDAAGNTGPSSAATATSVTVDRTAPTVSWGSAPSSPNNAASLTFPVTFSENVSGITSGDFTNAGTATGCVFTPSAASGTSVDVVASGCSEGTVQVQLAAGATADAAGNAGPAIAASSGAVTVDRTAPTATWTSPPTSPNNSSSITFAVSFSEMVSGIASGDFSNAGTATGCTFTPGASSGSLVSVVVTGCSDGTLAPVLQAGAITDLGGNAGPGVPASSGSIVVDRTAPTAAFTVVPTSPTRASSLSWTLAFSESVAGISASDFSNAGTATGCQFAVSASAGTSVNITATGCAEGSVELRMAAGSVTDGANAGPASATTAASVSVDRTAPATPVISGLPAQATSATAETVTFTGGEPGLSYECSLDGGAWAPCFSPESLTGLAEGGHAFRVRSTDAAGNTGPVASRSWSVDLTPPNLAPTATGMPTGTTSSSSLNPTISGEAGNTLMCQLDGAGWVRCTSLLPVTGLADGPHTLEARQQDPAGNNGPVASWVWAVDTAPPANPPQAGGGPASTSDNTPTFTFTGDAGNTFQCQVDSGAWTACTSPFTTPTLPDGNHTVKFRQVDGAGNTGPVETVSFTVDTQAPPEVGVSGIPPSPTNSQSASLTLTGSAGATIECRVDGGSWASCTSPLSLTGLAEGNHTVVLRQTGSNGVVSAETTIRWAVDLTPPTYAPGVVDRPDLETNATTAGFDLAAIAPDTLQCRLDGGSWGPCPSPLQYTGLADGNHTLEARARDQAGNTGPVSTVNWNIDRTPPSNQPTVLSVPSGTVADATADVSFGVDPGTTAQCSLDGATWQPCVSPLSLTGLADGSHTLRIRLVDAAGNAGPEIASTWAVDTTGPAAPTVTGVPTGTTATADLNASFTGEPGGSFECQLDGGSWTACTSPFTESGLTDGSHIFKVRQIDSLGNVGTARTSSWTVDTTAPSSAPSLGSGPAEGSSVTDTTPTFEFSGAPAGESYQCRIDGGAWAACTSPFTLPELALGSHSFEARLVDAAGNTGPVTRRDFEVVAPPAPPSSDRPRLVDSTPEVSGEGEVLTRVACDSPRPCRVTLSINIGGVSVAAGEGTIPAGQTGTIPVELPESLQARLAREGSITITVRSVIEVEGSRVETETSFRITAPPAREARNWRVKPSSNGDARFSASCEGTLSSRCDGTLTLYDASTFDTGTATSAAASKKVVVATAKLAGPSGKPIVVTAKLNAEGRKRLRRNGYLKIRPLVEFTGATASGQPAPYRINAMTTARWIRAALAAVESGGDVRKDLNRLLDRARGGSVIFSDAERTMARNIIPRRVRTLGAVKALPKEPSQVRGARSLAVCSMERSLAAGQEYRRYFATGSYRRYVKGSVHSHNATNCKDGFLARIRAAGEKAGVRVPYQNGLWP